MLLVMFAFLIALVRMVVMMLTVLVFRRSRGRGVGGSVVVGMTSGPIGMSGRGGSATGRSVLITSAMRPQQRFEAMRGFPAASGGRWRCKSMEHAETGDERRGVV